MNNKLYNLYRLVGNGLNISLLLFAAVPLVALSMYNHPSAVDDFCYIYTVREHGWIGGMAKYYNEWTGRYFGIFLNHSNPLLFDSIIGFKVLPVFLLIGIIGSCYLLFRTLTPTLSRRAHLGFAGVILFLFLLNLPNIPEQFYWMASFVTYTVPSILILIWISCTILWYRSDSVRFRKLMSVFCSILVFCAIGCSETTLMLTMGLIGCWFFYRIVIRKQLDKLMLIILIVSAYSCYLLLSSPGNTARLEGNPVSGNIPMGLFASFKFVFQSGAKWLISAPVLILTLAWIWVTIRMNKLSLTYFSPPIWFVALGFTALLAAIVFPSYYSINTSLDPSPRVVNCLYFFFLVGWFYFIGVVVNRFQPYLAKNLSNTNLIVPALYLACMTLVINSVRTTPNYKVMYRDWLKGKAKAYDKEMRERYTLLSDPKITDPVIPAIKNRPESLFVGDLNDDAKSWWNWCMAGYFGKNTIHLQQASESTEK